MSTKICKYCKHYIPKDSIYCGHCHKYQRKIKNHITFVNFGVLITLAMVIFIGIQSRSIKEQTNVITKEFTLKERPYLYVDVKPYIHKQVNKEYGKGLYAGAIMIYKNVGLFPASEIKTETKIDCFPDCTTNDPNVAEWYKSVYGTYPGIVTLFPGQASEPQKFHPGQSFLPENKKRWVYFGARIEYEGNEQKKYYYGVDCAYLIHRVKPPLYTLLKCDTYWDMMNENIPMPELNSDWEWVKDSKEYKRYVEEQQKIINEKEGSDKE